MSTEPRFLIVNADDFGRSGGVNSGVIKALERGIVTSASLLVRWPAGAEAAAYARRNLGFSLGLHVDLGEWTFRDGSWIPVYEVVPIDELSAVEREVRSQLSLFRHLVGRDPTHLDSHQHVHQQGPAAAVLQELANELAVPLRHAALDVHYCGGLYGQTATGTVLQDALSVHRMIEILRTLPAGTTELGCHPGEGSDIDSTYREEREIELGILCDPRVRAVVEHEGIMLCSFSDLASHRGW